MQNLAFSFQPSLRPWCKDLGDDWCKDGLPDYVYEIYRIKNLYRYFREAGDSHQRKDLLQNHEFIERIVLASDHDGEGTALVVASDSSANTFAGSLAVPPDPINVHHAESHIGTLTERCCATSYHVCYNHLGWMGTLSLQCKNQMDADSYKLCSKYTHSTSIPFEPVQNKSAPVVAYFLKINFQSAHYMGKRTFRHDSRRTTTTNWYWESATR